MKISIIYHSVTKNTENTAQIIRNGILEEGLEAKCMDVDNIDNGYLLESSAIIFGTPTYMGTFSWKIKKWFDEESIKSELNGKLGAVFVTENHIGGGAEVALLSLIGQILVSGMLAYSGGFAQGDPYIHYGAVCIKEGDAFQKERSKIFGKRIAKKTLELFER